MVVTRNLGRNSATVISAGLNSIRDYEIPDDTRSINFHGNQITKIEGLTSISLGQSLRSLDLSSNKIHVIENLDTLVNLRLLNLAANLISFIGPGLSNLCRLECLNLSYNQISNLNGLQCFANANSKLKSLLLHGNQIEKLTQVAPILKCLEGVKSLTFEIDGATNPFCRSPNYPSQIWIQAPHLLTLDGLDSSGVEDVSKMAIQEEEELAGLLGFLTSWEEDDGPDVLNDTSSSDAFPSNPDETLSSSASDSQTNLIREAYPKIEAVLNQFRNPPVILPSRDSDKGDNVTDRFAPNSNGTESADDDRLANIEKQLQELLQQRESNTAAAAATPTKEAERVNGKNVDEITQTEATNVEATKSDDVKSTGANDDAYLRNLLGQLDEEREKRWTTQKKYDDLSVTLSEVNEKRAQERKQIEEALTLVRRLQARLDSGKASQKELEQNVDSLSVANEKLERDCKMSKQREAALQRLLREVQEKGNRQNKDKDDRIQTVEKDLEDAMRESKLAAYEAEKFRRESDELKTLVTEKEKEHQETLRGKYSIGSVEIQTLLTKEGDRISETYKMQVEMWRRKYQDLEDEFRLALHLEADRFTTLQKNAEETRRENEKLNAALSDLVAREARASGLVKELSDLAKVQKTKMTDMTKSHQNSLQNWRKKCEIAERALSTARERTKAMDESVTAKSQLETKCTSLETLVKNIKAEKELWSSELAQQGAALSQDRGRLEAKVEALTAEVSSLKKQLERDTDSLRIKSKVIEDQTETIKKLKDGLLERDRRIKEANEEHLAKERDSEKRADEEVQNRRAAEERIEYLEGRKEELKANVKSLEDELTAAKSNNEKLVQKWKDRSKLIDSLEIKVAEMKKSWDEKEAALTRERDAANAEKEETRSKSASIDAAFRSQLDRAQAAHARSLAELEELKNLELEEAKAKLTAAEDEMREILREAAEHKTQMHLKIKKLTSAFADLQN